MKQKYSGQSIALTFLATSLLFGVMAAYGYLTCQDVTRLGNLLLVGLITLLTAGLLNLWLASDILDRFFTYAGILIFLGLTACDVKALWKIYLASVQAGEKP